MSDVLDVSTLLDPGARDALANFPLDLGTLSDETLPAIRAAMAQFPVPELSDRVIRTDHDAGGVTIRVHRPAGVDGALPCVYWMHGGGLVLGTYAGDDARFDLWCQKYGCVGVSVEYRLAPETPYPGPLEDCYRGCAGCTTTPPSWASIRSASASVGPAPAPVWPPVSPCSPATGARSRCSSSC
ncbi:MAG: alpha/beta hydrolase [Acidimicrobiales bacterium]